MQSLSVDGFSSDEIKAALHAPSRTVAFKYELLDNENDHKGWLDNVMSCSIENNALASIKRTAKLRVRDNGDINYLSDRVRPWFRLRMGEGWAEWPLGIFLLSSPKRDYKPTGAEREIEAYDQLIILEDDKVEDRYAVATGANYIDAVRTLLTDAGIVRRNLVSTDKVLPATREWKPGTSRLSIVRDLLSSINYRSLYFDSSGSAVAEPYQSPSDRPTGYTYAADRLSLLEPEVAIDFDLFGVPNKWIVTVSEPDRPELTASYTNVSAESPTSTVSRGRTIVDFRKEDAADQDALNSKVARLAFEASQVYEIVEIGTAIMPHHEDAEIIRLTYDDAGLSARYTEHKWSMDLRAGASMKHTLRRVVSV